MGISQHIVNINDRAYVIDAFVGTKGFSLLARLSKYATPVIGAMVDKNEGDNSIDLAPIMQNLFFEGTEDFVKLVFDLVSDVSVDGIKINIDKEFKQNYISLLTLALEVIKLNYNDVFQKLGMNFD